MPITKSAKKALRGSLRKRAFNLKYKKNIQDATKTFKKLVAEKKTKEVLSYFKNVQKSLDKAVKHGYIKKNTAARRKSRLVKLINKV